MMTREKALRKARLKAVMYGGIDSINGKKLKSQGGYHYLDGLKVLDIDKEILPFVEVDEKLVEELMITNFAYLDADGVLHCVEDEDDAIKFARGRRYVECKVAVSETYPAENGDKLIVNSDEKKFHSNEVEMEEEEFAKKYPHTYKLFKLL